MDGVVLNSLILNMIASARRIRSIYFVASFLDDLFVEHLGRVFIMNT